MLPFIMITCKKATFLVSKKEDKKISFWQAIQLRMHLAICSFCRRFEKQSWIIGENAKHLHDHADHLLSQEKKEQIQSTLDKLK